MKIFKTIVLILLIGLGIGSGIAKITLIPEELAFFKGVGFDETLLILFGAVQLASSCLLIFKKYRKTGAFILAITFLISTVLIFLSGDVSFALFSILPILMIGFTVNDKNIIGLGKNT